MFKSKLGVQWGFSSNNSKEEEEEEKKTKFNLCDLYKKNDFLNENMKS